MREHVPQRLKRQTRPTARFRELAHHRGEIAARAVADDGQTSRIAAQFRGMVHRPAERRVAVLDGNRKPVFGRPPIVDADDDRVRMSAVVARGGIMGIEIARHDEWRADDRRAPFTQPPRDVNGRFAAGELERWIGDNFVAQPAARNLSTPTSRHCSISWVPIIRFL